LFFFPPFFFFVSLMDLLTSSPFRYLFVLKS
jgi:hypothetical protein